MTNPPAKAKHEFRVSIDYGLPPEVADRIEKAIQKSVLNELASLDVAGPFSVNFLGARSSEGGGGGPQGIAIIAERL
jgi:hypothetical protein